MVALNRQSRASAGVHKSAGSAPLCAQAAARARGRLWLPWLLWLVCAAMLCAWAAPSRADDGAQVVTFVEALLVDHTQPGAPARRVSLPDAWEHKAPEREGSVSYHFDLPPQALAGGQPAVLIRRVGNIFRVLLNAQPVAEVGEWRSPLPNHGNEPVLLRLPRALLTPQGNQLEVVVIGEPRREAGLSLVRVGPEHLLDGPYRRAYLEQVLGSWMMAAACATMGLLALLAAGRTRQMTYAWFAAANLLWAWRVLAPMVHDPPLLPLWQWAFYVSYNWFVALIIMYVMVVLRIDRPWLRWALLTYALAAAVAGAMVWLANWPWLRTGMLLVGLGFVVFATARVVHTAIVVRSTTAILLSVSAVVSTALGMRDWVVFRVLQEYGAYTWARYSVLLFLLVLGWTLVDEFAKSLRGLQTLNAGLQDTLAEKERALTAAFDRARDQDRRVAARTERDHILREMHDGLGGRLVSAISLARAFLPGGAGADTDRARALNDALDDSLVELRLALDTLEVEKQTLSEALAELRYRVEPSLRAAGVKLQWDVDEAATCARLPAAATLNVLRIVREALTNIIKHAGATTARLSLHTQPRDDGAAGLQIDVVDNGSGAHATLPPAQVDMATAPDHAAGFSPRSRGLSSMQARARQLNAQLRAGPGSAGWQVSLWLPLPAPPPGVGDATGLAPATAPKPT